MIADYCFKQFSEPKRNMIDAEKYCVNLGGHLASFASEAEWNIIKGHMDSSNADKIWIGLMDYEDYPAFTDDSPVTYHPPTGPKQYLEQCFRYIKLNTILDIWCGIKYSFVCKIPSYLSGITACSTVFI